MKLKRLILIGLIISIRVLNAQTDFRPGYIIKYSGDTLYGEIDYRGDKTMSSICRFRDTTDDVHIYTPNDILAYRFIDSKYYVSKEIIENKKVFFEYLIKGEVNIFYMRDEEGDHYYLSKKDERLMELPYEEGKKYVGNKEVFYESTDHNRILNYYMHDAPGFQSRINSLKKPGHQNLIKLAEDYHNAVCEGEKCIIYEKKLPSVKISIEPFGGFTYYNVFGSSEYDRFIYELGVFLYFWSPRSNENVFLKTGFVYNKLPIDDEEQKIYKIPVQFQYIYHTHRFQPGIGGGFNILSLKSEGDIILGLAFSLNASLDFRLSNKLNLCTAFNSDFMPKNFISFSFIFGVRIDL